MFVNAEHHVPMLVILLKLVGSLKQLSKMERVTNVTSSYQKTGTSLSLSDTWSDKTTIYPAASVVYMFSYVLHVLHGGFCGRHCDFFQRLLHEFEHSVKSRHPKCCNRWLLSHILWKYKPPLKNILKCFKQTWDSFCHATFCLLKVVQRNSLLYECTDFESSKQSLTLTKTLFRKCHELFRNLYR